MVEALILKYEVNRHVVNKVSLLHIIQCHCCNVEACMIALSLLATCWIQDGAGGVHLACLNGKSEMVQMLVEDFGLSVNLKDKVCVSVCYCCAYLASWC